MDYEVMPYAPEFETQIAEAQRHLWSGDVGRNAAYFRWKYRENPFLDEPLIHLALWGGRVVGMRGMFGTCWQVDDADSCHVLPYADDLVVAPEHRNRRVVSAIMETALDDLARRGFPYAVSLSAGPVTFVGSLAAGWRSAGSYQPVWRREPAHPRGGRARSLARRVPSLRKLVIGMLGVLGVRGVFRELDREARQRPGPVSSSREPRPAAMAELVARLPWDGRIRHVRDAAYFAWRFRNPFREYRFLFWDGDGLQGYLVLQRSTSDRGDPTRINIIDWEATDDRVRADLLATALGRGGFPRVHAWTVGVGESTRNLLQTRGFVPFARPDVRLRSQGLLVRRLGTGSPAPRWALGSRDLLRIENWDLRMLYSTAS